ncbi:hypothetical protein EMPS_06041 [Entomortierella parvispora]|uniref:ARM repeat-containing protein n=1 Tax=Entomortierella parvispora TaxID=205924 RepID=A0A9P3HC49_9FUNG|nr:hypothetical protein EMPS_06041 [Entomortierella parvispora]
MMSANNTDATPQDDASFASLVQDIQLSAQAADPTSVEAHIPRLVSQLESAKTQLKAGEHSDALWDQVANDFQFFGDAARKEQARTPIGESKVIELIVELEAFNSERKAHVDIQAMRALANACVDHEANRLILLKENAFDTIVDVLRNSTHADSIKNACGALLNTTMSCEPAQTKVVELGAVEQLLKVLETQDLEENEVTVTIAARVSAFLCELDTGIQAIIKNSGIKTLIQLLERTCQDVESYVDIIDAVTDILRPVAAKDSAQKAIFQEGLLTPLLDILENAGTSDEGKTEEEKKEDDKKFAAIKADLIEVVVSVTLADANMIPIFNDKEIMHRFLTWLDLADREDLQTCAALCLGNVARSDQHCITLVHEYQAVEPLIHVVRKAVDLKASHAATGVLRNLALPEKNREQMGNAGVIQACFPLLKKDNALPLQSNIVGILKRLCTNDGYNSIRVISGREPFETLSSTSNAESELETPLSTLVELIDRTDDFALKSEGTRTLCNLIKVTWGSDCMTDIDDGSIRALQQTLNKTEVVLPIAAMTRNPKFVVLQNEGVIALTLLVTSPTQDKNAVLDSLVSVAVTPQPDPETTITEDAPVVEKAASFTLLESLLSLIKNKDGKCPDEVRTNVCVLLRNALDSASRDGEDPAYLTFLKSSDIKDTLTEVQSQPETRPLVKTAIGEVLSRL